MAVTVWLISLILRKNGFRFDDLQRIIDKMRRNLLAQGVQLGILFLDFGDINLLNQ